MQQRFPQMCTRTIDERNFYDTLAAKRISQKSSQLKAARATANQDYSMRSPALPICSIENLPKSLSIDTYAHFSHSETSGTFAAGNAPRDFSSLGA